MKRFNKTAVALATAGAMTVAMVPNAMAQTGAPAQTIPNPANADEECYLHNSGEFYVSDRNDWNTPADKIENKCGTSEDAEKDQNNQRAEDSASDMKPGDLPDGGVVGETHETYVPENGAENSEELKPEDVFGEKDPNISPAQTIPNPANPDEECYLHNSGEFYVSDRNDWNTPADQIDDKCKVLIDPETDPTDEPGAGENPADDDKDTSKVLRALAALAGVGAVIHLLGKVYRALAGSHGPVLVPYGRADQAPTAEDEAATDQLVAEHGEEIVAQAAEAGVADNGVAADNGADADRGVSAATGNNNLAQGLIGLLLASILGAAAFVFGRRQLV